MTLHTINHQICAVIVLSIVLMTHGISGRQDMGAYIARQDVPLLDELLASANEDALYSELKKYHRQQPNYLSKWPGLRDLLLTTDYDDNAVESNEVVNTRFIERLRELAASTVDMEDVRDQNVGGAPEVLPTAMPLKKLSSTGLKDSFKDHGTKKNVQYMSPCHFKICNMGRKRATARFYANY